MHASAAHATRSFLDDPDYNFTFGNAIGLSHSLSLSFKHSEGIITISKPVDS